MLLHQRGQLQPLYIVNWHWLQLPIEGNEEFAVDILRIPCSVLYRVGLVRS